MHWGQHRRPCARGKDEVVTLYLAPALCSGSHDPIGDPILLERSDSSFLTAGECYPTLDALIAEGDNRLSSVRPPRASIDVSG